jgi:Domain of unknown function (DUF4326)
MLRILKPRSLGPTKFTLPRPLPPHSSYVVNQKNRPASNVSTVYIGRPSMFGNPYRIGVDGTREEVIQKYDIWAREMIDMDDEFKAAVKALKGKLLVCWCRPLACHGDALVRLAEELNR